MAGGGHPDEAAKPAGLSFALGKSTQRRVAVQQEQVAVQRELITGISENGVETQEKRTTLQRGALVIPKVEDTFQVGVGRTARQPRFVPSRDDGAGMAVEERFEVAAAEAAPAVEVMYGLNISARSQPSSRGGARDRDGSAEPAQLNGLNGHAEAGGAQNGSKPSSRADRPSVTSREWETKTFQEDIVALPDEAHLEAYESMPIEEFGAAMLRGMGWQDGGGVGRSRQVVKAIEYVRRPDRLGLGAAPAPVEQKVRKYIKPGESREARKDLVYIDAEGRQKHVKGIDDKLVERPATGPAPGRKMRVLAGRHAGLACDVLALEPKVEGRSDRVVVRLEPSRESVTVRVSELGERWETPSAAAAKGDSKPDGGRDRKREAKEEARREKKKRRAGRDGDSDAGPLQDADEPQKVSSSRPTQSWLVHNIRVRIIDKNLRNGKLYLKKGTVVGVHQPTVCDVYVDEVKHSQLETVIPKNEGGRVMLVTGEWRGEVAKLLQRSAASQMAAVQLLSDLSVHKVPFDDMAEFMGDTHD